jgi:hypothetical protein
MRLNQAALSVHFKRERAAFFFPELSLSVALRTHRKAFG